MTKCNSQRELHVDFKNLSDTRGQLNITGKISAWRTWRGLFFTVPTESQALKELLLRREESLEKLEPDLWKDEFDDYPQSKSEKELDIWYYRRSQDDILLYKIHVANASWTVKPW